MFFIKLFLIVFAGAFIVKEAVLTLDDIVYALRRRRVKSINSEKLFPTRNIKP